jgi:hypothetical protein
MLLGTLLALLARCDISSVPAAVHESLVVLSRLYHYDGPIAYAAGQHVTSTVGVQVLLVRSWPALNGHVLREVARNLCPLCQAYMMWCWSNAVAGLVPAVHKVATFGH